MHRRTALSTELHSCSLYKYSALIHCHLCVCVCSVVLCTYLSEQLARKMQSSHIIVLACLVAIVAARAHPAQPVVDAAIPSNAAIYESVYEVPAHEHSSRTKRSIILLKKKLLLGALGLKALKIGALGAAVSALQG